MNKLPILLVLLSSNLHGQVNVSEAFQNTLKKVAKEHVKEDVISWITERDVIGGIIGRDLIAQLLDGKDEATLLRSTTNFEKHAVRGFVWLRDSNHRYAGVIYYLSPHAICSSRL